MTILELFADEGGSRLDVFLTDNSDLTRSAVRRLITDGSALVNGKVAKPSNNLRPGDSVILSIPDSRQLEALPEDIPLSVVFEDNHIIVIDKPKGMVVHPAPGHSGGTLVNALLARCEGELSGINGVTRPGIVHRIDKDTSGLLVVAKNDVAHFGLAAQLSEHEIKREYSALAFGVFKSDSGIVDAPIGRDPKERKRMAVVPKGRTAVTRYTVAERFSRYTLLTASLQTGRTHQIRVHMKYIGHPLLGDSVYGGCSAFGAVGQTLHARCLSFTHPVTGEKMEFTAPMPDYFISILKKIRATPGK